MRESHLLGGRFISGLCIRNETDKPAGGFYVLEKYGMGAKG